MLAAVASSGNCSAVFQEVVSATESNYAGYIIKLPDEGARLKYRRFRQMMAGRAENASNRDACRDVLETYTGFFADHHLFVASRGDGVSPIPDLAGRWTDSRARDYFHQRGDLLDPVEGFWFDANGQIAVVRDAALGAGQFVGIRTTGSNPGIAVALIERQPDGYRIRHKDESESWQVRDSVLRRGGDPLLFGTRGWGRAGAMHLNSSDPMAPMFKEMGDGVYYLSMPSFMPNYREHLQKIIAENRSSMANASGLVMDVRGNAGGDAIYFSLAPYLLANDIVISKPSSVRASEWTREHFEQQRKQMGESGAWLDGPLERMRKDPGGIVTFLEGATDGMPDYPERPEGVVVLQDRGVGSAAEAFIYHARQSKKVVTMGEPTRGNIDYMQVSKHKVGSGDFQYWFGYPLYFDRSLPATSVDDEGYAPDVRLTIPADEWVPFAKEWLSHLSD